MATYTVTKIIRSTTPVAIENVTVEYKLWSATSYILVDNNVDVNTDDTLVTPLPITGLTVGEVYNIRASSNCSSPIESYVQTVTITT